MSLKIFSTVAIVLNILAAGVIYTQYSSKNTFQLPVSASYPRSQFSSKGVVNRIIQVKLQHDDVNTDADKTTVYAQLTMPFAFNGPLKYRWKLGENVILHEGTLTGELGSLPQGASVPLSITVSGFSKENNHHIAFEIFAQQRGRAIGGDSLIASDPESTFEDIVQNVERIKASQK